VHFFGCQLAQSLRGNLSIDCTFLTCESLDAIGTCMECMSRNAFEDIHTCLHVDDEWDRVDKWGDGDINADKKMQSGWHGTSRQEFLHV
jgi:hypothetical protein